VELAGFFCLFFWNLLRLAAFGVMAEKVSSEREGDDTSVMRLEAVEVGSAARVAFWRG
jgi:hypothetical protein